MQDKQSNSTQGAHRRELMGLVGRVTRRVRLQRALARGTSALLIFLMGMAIVVTLYSTGWIESATLRNSAILLGLFPAAFFLWGWFLPVDRVAIAQRIDRSNHLHDRLSTALSLLEEGRDDAFVHAQIQDALAYRDKVDTRLAAPFAPPPDLVPCALFLAAVVLLALFEPPSHVHPLPEPLLIQHDRILSGATVAMERERLEQLRKSLEDVKDPKIQQLLQEMNALLDDVDAQNLSEKEFLARIDEIERKFFDAEQDKAAAEIAERLKKAAEALEKEAGDALKEHEEIKKAIDALKEKDLAKAADALQELAEKLKKDELTQAEAEKLAKLLESFADKIDLEDPEIKALIEKHRDLFEKLNMKFNSGAKMSDAEKQQLQREKEKLEELEKQRDQNAKSKATRQLKSLERITRDMAEKIGKEGQAVEDAEPQDGKDKQGGQQQDGRQQKDGQQGSQQAQNDGQKGQQEGQKSQNDGQQGQQDGGDRQQNQKSSAQREAGQMAEGASRALQQGSEQQRAREAREQAQRQLDEMKETMRRSAARPDQGNQEDGESAENMRKFLQRASGEQSDADAQKQASAKKPGKEGDGKDAAQTDQAGSATGDKTLGEVVNIDGKAQDTRVEGRQGDGPTKSEVIKAASEKGFATTDYKDVFVDYEAVVEEVMDREEVPAGYRYYVKRYFELIRPRD